MRLKHKATRFSNRRSRIRNGGNVCSKNQQPLGGPAYRITAVSVSYRGGELDLRGTRFSVLRRSNVSPCGWAGTLQLLVLVEQLPIGVCLSVQLHGEWVLHAADPTYVLNWKCEVKPFGVDQHEFVCHSEGWGWWGWRRRCTGTEVLILTGLLFSVGSASVSERRGRWWRWMRGVASDSRRRRRFTCRQSWCLPATCRWRLSGWFWCGTAIWSVDATACGCDRTTSRVSSWRTSCRASASGRCRRRPALASRTASTNDSSSWRRPPETPSMRLLGHLWINSFRARTIMVAAPTVSGTTTRSTVSNEPAVIGACSGGLPKANGWAMRFRITKKASRNNARITGIKWGSG